MFLKIKVYLKSFLKKIGFLIITSFLITFYISEIKGIKFEFSIGKHNINVVDYFLLCLIIMFLYLVIDSIIFFIENKSHKYSFDYLRELPRDYSPSMVSVLTNMKFEYKKDLLADLLYLEEKNIIKISSKAPFSIEIINNMEFSIAESHLSFLIGQIAKMQKPTIEDFYKDNVMNSFILNYRNAIYSDLLALNLIKQRKSLYLRSYIPLIVLAIIAFIIIFISVYRGQMPINGIFDCLVVFVLSLVLEVVMFIPIFIYFYVINIVITVYKGITKQNYVRTKKGKEDVSIWFAYYDFLKDFSLLDDKRLEEKELWGFYYAYGVALGINKYTIEELSLNHELYMIR